MADAVVLVEPATPGNIGSVARVMKNFGYRQLLLVNPKCSHLSAGARKLASHAADVLRNAKTVQWQDVLQYDYVIGTTAKLGQDYNIPRSPLSPKAAAAKIARIRERSVALVLGRENTGLRNTEIRDCDFIVTIPAASYKSLNISHAAAILLYEICQAGNKTALTKTFTPISGTEKKVLLQLIGKKLSTLSFPTAEKRETQRRVWKRLLGKALLTKREAFALLGFFRRL